MKALYLDWNNVNGFADCCGELGISLVAHRYNPQELTSTVAEFAETFKKDILTADLLVSTGNFSWLRFFGEGFGVQEAFCDAIRSGTQFIFEAPRAWDHNYGQHSQQPNSEYVREVFDVIGVKPTQYRVFTDDAASGVGGGAIGFFRSGDNCFLNADVLGECDSIVLGQANILDADRGAFPVVETGPLHVLVDHRDLLAPLAVGLRPAVFVEVKRDKMSGYVIGGRFFSDAYEAVGGMVPGIELNRPVVMALLRKIVGRKQQSTGFEIGVYRDLFDFERTLGDILIARLPRHEASLLKEASLTVLIQATLDSWDKVRDLFEPMDRAGFSKTTSAIPNGVRLYLCHPIKLNFNPGGISEASAQQLRLALQVVRTARGRL
jgi:hypothetical protein